MARSGHDERQRSSVSKDEVEAVIEDGRGPPQPQNPVAGGSIDVHPSAR